MTDPSTSLAAYAAARCSLDDPFVELDLSRSRLEDRHLELHGAALERALSAMRALEEGAVANPDEGRMVGHYWLRAPALAPSDELTDAIGDTLDAILRFRDRIHAEDRWARVLVVGIGGSGLGPMLLADALEPLDAPLRVTVLDNTDPDGIDRALARHGDLGDTLVVVISKSGGTPETRNGMLEVVAACERQGHAFAERAIAVSGDGSALWKRSLDEGWLARFPMWDWVGGRTSLWSAVGLVPAALSGVDVHALLAGAAAMDVAGRREDLRGNPAAMTALYWYVQGDGRGARDLVMLPYRDRLVLFSRYLQQLVMESLGKELDRSGRQVFQGLSVFGNKGSTDQHAYVQQLRDGLDNFFVTFVRVLHDRDGEDLEVDEGVRTGDYLDGFWLGTRAALADRGRATVTLTLERLDERSLGALLALFERAVGIYAELVNINAYHQPGVEAGKQAAGEVLATQRRLLDALSDEPRSAEQLAAAAAADPETAWHVLRHLAMNRADVRLVGDIDPIAARFQRRS